MEINYYSAKRVETWEIVRFAMRGEYRHGMCDKFVELFRNEQEWTTGCPISTWYKNPDGIYVNNISSRSIARQRDYALIKPASHKRRL